MTFKTKQKDRGAIDLSEGIALDEFEPVGYGTATGTELEPDARLIVESPGIKGAVRAFGHRLAQGELGNLPVLLGIAIIWTIFQLLNPRFLSPLNLTNL